MQKFSWRKLSPFFPNARIRFLSISREIDLPSSKVLDNPLLPPRKPADKESHAAILNAKGGPLIELERGGESSSQSGCAGGCGKKSMPSVVSMQSVLRDSG
jgi:hypothetical protein